MFDQLLGWRRRAAGTVQPDAKLRPSRDVLVAERDGVAVLLDLRRSVYLGLDEVGTVAWREIESGGSAASATRRVCEQYDAPADLVQADIQKFITDLRRRRLVVTA
ncbi:MAG TPA: PqqD family protein [Longimicrobiales bacterium]|jgi:hypothetical protein|nr:PqqD family protein [Longimicrobiales bacterium]